MIATHGTLADLPHRRFISWGVIAAMAGVVALVTGTVAWATSEAIASDGRPIATARPSPTASALDVLPTKYADARRMTDDAWREVDSSWDVMVVSYAGQAAAPRPRGSYGLYLTPPGGERRLAFAVEDLPDSMVRALAWDPANDLLLLATAGHQFRVASMRTGTYVELDAPTSEDVTSSEGIGRASNGLNYVALGIDDGGEPHTIFAAWDGQGWKESSDNGYGAVSPLRGDLLVATRGDDLVTYDVVTGEESAPYEGLSGCSFASWATSTDFAVHCPNPSGYEDVFGVNLNGETTYLGSAGDPGGEPFGERVLMTGTPVTLQDVEGPEKYSVGILTEAGVHVVGEISTPSGAPSVRLIEGNRWALGTDGGFPYVLDAARGTLVFTGEGFGDSPVTVVVLPGDRG